MAKKYAQEEVLVSAQWVADHTSDPKVRIVESDEDVLLYNQGHVPGAVRIDWHNDLQDAVVRDYVGQEAFAELCASKGISGDTTRGMLVRVEDDGPGIESGANLFVPFFTTKPQGSGIGLVLSRQIAEAHGGSLALDNRVGATGCVAVLRLPIRTTAS